MRECSRVPSRVPAVPCVEERCIALHIEDSQIHPELRRTGRILRTLAPASFSPRTLRLSAAVMNAAERLRVWPGKSPRPRHVGVERPDGTRCPVWVFEPARRSEKPAPDVLWIHGGGFALGAPLQDFGFIDLFVSLGCTVVSPHYRLSTEAPYPAAFDDCYRTLEWAYDRFCEAQDRKLAVGGDSAGGGLCVAVCLKSRDAGGPPVAFHMPLYPMLDDRMATPSSRDNDAPVWNSASNEAAWRLYLGGLSGTDDVPAYAAPARARDFAGMPPGCTYVGSVEPFHDETISYVDALRSAGVGMDLLVLPGCFHGFDLVCPRSTPAREARSFLERSFREGLGYPS